MNQVCITSYSASFQNRLKCSPLLLLWLVVGCLPKPPKYPFKPKSELNKEDQDISDKLLEAYIKKWLC